MQYQNSCSINWFRWKVLNICLILLGNITDLRLPFDHLEYISCSLRGYQADNNTTMSCYMCFFSSALLEKLTFTNKYTSKGEPKSRRIQKFISVKNDRTSGSKRWQFPGVRLTKSWFCWCDNLMDHVAHKWNVTLHYKYTTFTCPQDNKMYQFYCSYSYSLEITLGAKSH